MRRGMIMAAAFALLASCGRHDAARTAAEGGDDVAHVIAATLPAAPDETAACNLRASTFWHARETILQVFADYEGVTCADAAMRLFIVDEEGRVLYRFEAPARAFDVQLGDGQDGNDAMRNAVRAVLDGWIDPEGRAMPSTTALAPWPEGAPAPFEAGEEDFPFAPAQDLDRASYLALRAADRPMWCFMSARTTMTCAAYEAASGRVRDVGTQESEG